MSAAGAQTWSELQRVAGVSDLPFPWPVKTAERLGQHASLRRFYRLRPGRSTAGSSLVLVLYQQDDPDAVAAYERAARWFEDAGVRVPRVHGSSARALIVEDGGDLLLATAPEGPRLESAYAEAAAAILALQDFGRSTAGPNPDWRLDQERLRRELAFTEEHALRGWLRSPPSRGREQAFDRLAEAVARQPTRICHRDYHSRNLLLGEELMVLDFQDAMTGPILYDLVSLLGDDYRDIPLAAETVVLEAFWSGCGVDLAAGPQAEVPAGPAPLPPGARQGFALTAAQRSLKALGTFGYQVSVAGRSEYAAFAHRAWGHARRSLEGLGWHDLIERLASFEAL